MDLLKKSKNYKEEYACTVVKIETVEPIEGSDFLGKTLVNFEPIVVRKDQVKEGDILIYASNECQLNAEFLSKNNLYEFGSRELNSNYKEVEEMIAVDKEKAKRMVGYFARTGRVRQIRLCKQLSFGYLFSIDEFAKYNPKVKKLNLEDYIGEDFDMVDDEIFVKPYVPLNKKGVPNNGHGNNSSKRNKKIKKLNRMIDGEFLFHYDTSLLAKNIRNINPNECVTISKKLHGSSYIVGNVKVKNYFKLPILHRVWNWACDMLHLDEDNKYINYTIDYGNVYSSRNVIKNANYNPNVTGGYYGLNDIWEEANKVFEPFVSPGMTVYGEIVGYVPGTSKMIQKDYDYGCQVGECKYMPYRITSTTNDGDKFEWEVTDVKDWTNKIVNENPELKNQIIPIPILYNGQFKDLYPDIEIDEVWHEHVLLRMQEDKERFHMEEMEPMCKYHQVPTEGVVLRVCNDPKAEAFKLKCKAFLNKEAKLYDKGEVDVEAEQTLNGEE